MKPAAIWLAVVAFIAWLAIDAGVKMHREARLSAHHGIGPRAMVLP
jgi:hypothetical protein